MGQYRLTDLDLSTRLELTLEMLIPAQERGWGRASELAQQHGISRTLLYDWRDKALQSIQASLQPEKPGPKPLKKVIEINPAFIKRAITVLPMVTGSVRGIQTALRLLLKVDRSVGYINQTLHAVGQKIAGYQQAQRLPLPVLAEADEIFQGRKPCLTIVDGRSFMVLNLTPATGRDATHWGVTFLELLAQGVQIQDIVSDGAKGIAAGVQEAELAVPLRPDLFHLLQQAHPISRRLERAAYQAITTTERVKRATQEALTAKRRRGRPLKVELSLAEAKTQMDQAIDHFELWHWLLSELRLVLEPIQAGCRLVNSLTTRETLQLALSLMSQVGQPDITAFAEKLTDYLEALIAPLAWLETTLAPWRLDLKPEDEAFILWYWQHRQTLAMPVSDAFPVSLLPVAEAFVSTLTLFHRASSLAESFHSWLRPHLQIHRGMPPWLGPLLQLFWNHHRFQRGKRAGSTPLELAGITNAPPLETILDDLLSQENVIPPQPYSLLLTAKKCQPILECL